MAEINFPETVELSGQDDPLAVFSQWLKAAEATEPSYPTAMQLATVGEGGMPSIRTVLMRGFDARGFCFYTNGQSRKAGQLNATQKAGAVFYWKTQMRQVHLEGTVEKVSDAESDAYFATRPYGHKIAALASDQSRPLTARAVMLERIKQLETQHPTDVPRPPHWHGFRLVPNRIEFWQEGKHRVHDRFVFTRTAKGWNVQRLNP